MKQGVIYSFKDGKLVVMHDESFNRTTNGSGIIVQLNFEQIKNLDAGSWKDSLFADVKVTTLDEDLEKINIYKGIKYEKAIFVKNCICYYYSY